MGGEKGRVIIVEPFELLNLAGWNASDALQTHNGNI